MRFRTKFFLASSVAVLLLWAGTLWPVERTVRLNFDRVAAENFSATRQGLGRLQAEHIARMRQIGRMFIEIPELRALIAENQFEVSPENLASLRDQLKTLSEVVDTPFLCVLDSRGTVVAQDPASPWPTLDELRAYLSGSPQARTLVAKLFGPSRSNGSERGEYGLWVYHGRLFQVVGLPLVFRDDDDHHAAPSDGALIMAAPIDDTVAVDLAQAHHCQISFLAGGSTAATSLPRPERDDLLKLYASNQWPATAQFDLSLAGNGYRSYVEPLVDPCSETTLGSTIIQSSVADGLSLEDRISSRLVIIMSISLVVAALAGFVISGQIAKPILELVRGVRHVAGGDLTSSISVNRHDELGELATAFNDMVSQLRAREQLQHLVEESQAATKAKSQFLANMSHEIRTPLHGVIGITDLLMSTELNERQHHYARLIKSSTEVLTSLINDILDFSKIEAGKLELESADFNLHTVVKDVVELLSYKATEKNVRLACDISLEVPSRVRGDSSRLRQILMNLVNNAVKFTQRGEILVRVGREKSSSEGLSLRFVVSDTGIGIPAERIDRLFKSFSQVDASTTRRFGGTGLGLAICRQLVELMGGKIGVESEAGKGSRFWFTTTFKTVDSAAMVDGEDSASQPPDILTNGQPTPLHPSKRFRVLVAEDNEVNQIVAVDFLAKVGCDCQVVNNGKSAVESEVKNNFDLILMDCQMPEMDGFDATREIRGYENESAAAGKQPRRVPIIALTANASTADRARCLGAGMDAYCEKPFRTAELIQTIKSFLSDHTPTSPDRSTVKMLPQAESPSENIPPLNFDEFFNRCSFNASMALTILDKFEQQMGAAVEQIRGHLSTNNDRELARLVHTLKGTSGIVAAAPLREVFARLETICRDGAPALGPDQLANLQREIDRCLSFLPRVKSKLEGRLESQSS